MKVLQKRLVTGILCLSGMCGAMGSASAFWPFSCKNESSEKCKEKFEQSCALIEEKEEECHKELADLYSIVDKLSDDMNELKSAQVISENILTKLTVAYEEWKQDDFRIDTQYHTDYILLKKKFSDQNRVVNQDEQLVKEDIKVLNGLLNTQNEKDKYVSSLKGAIDSYYKYIMAVAREDIDKPEE